VREGQGPGAALRTPLPPSPNTNGNEVEALRHQLAPRPSRARHALLRCYDAIPCVSIQSCKRHLLRVGQLQLLRAGHGGGRRHSEGR
jgi:hypothetical protein